MGIALPLPRVFVSVADKGVTGAKSVSVASKRLTHRQLRSISAKTRSSSTSVASKGLSAVIFSLRAPEKRKRPEQFGARGNGTCRHQDLSIARITILSRGYGSDLQGRDKSNGWASGLCKKAEGAVLPLFVEAVEDDVDDAFGGGFVDEADQSVSLRRIHPAASQNEQRSARSSDGCARAILRLRTERALTGFRRGARLGEIHFEAWRAQAAAKAATAGH